MKKKSDYINAGAIIILHLILLNAGFLILINVFQFPDILRMTPEYRLRLFCDNSTVVIPVYYLLSLTGFTQIIMSLTMHQVLDDDSSYIKIATVFGILTGVFQSLGFIRWVVVIPYFSELFSTQGTNPSVQTIIPLLEGAFNRYSGMSVGEHLGFIAQGLWTLCIGISLISNKLFDKRLAWTGILIGVLIFPMSLESLGGIFHMFIFLVVPVSSLWAVWLILLAFSMFRITRKSFSENF